MSPNQPPGLAELGAHLSAAGLSHRKLPEQLVIVDQLPRNAMTKVQKAVLRRRYSDVPVIGDEGSESLSPG